MMKINEAKPRVLIHIGYPKTGTTSLQKHIFSSFRGVCYLGLYDRHGELYKFNESAIESIYTESSFSFDKKIDDFHKLDQSNYIFSEENLLTECMIPSRSRKGYERRTQDINVVLSNLKAFFSCADIEILMTIRRQKEIIPSFYAQHYHKRFKSIKATSTASAYISEVLKGGGIAAHYNYNSVYEAAINCFGVGNVTVIPMEMISTDSKKFIDKIGAVLGADSSLRKIPFENVRKGKGVYKVDDIYNMEAIFNKAFKCRVSSAFLRSIRLPKLMFPTEFRVSEKLLSKIDAEFSTSNKILSKKIDIDLHEYEYF